MATIYNGVKKETLNNIEFEQGVILTAPYTSSTTKENVLCATTGGIKVNIAANKQTIAFDGMLDNTAGLERVIGWTASVQFSTKEVDADKVKLALGFATKSDSASQKVTLKQGVIDDDYYENDLYIVGFLGNGTARQVHLKNVINTTGLQETRNSKGETEISFDLQAYYSIDDQDTPPIEIIYGVSQV